VKELKRNSNSSNTLNNTDGPSSPHSVVAALAAIKKKESKTTKAVSKTQDVERGDAPEISHPKPLKTSVLYKAPKTKNLTIDVIEY
jgi:hypothetical protein